MSDILDANLDATLAGLLDVGQGEPWDVEKTLSPRAFHTCGLELLAQGYSAQAELCFRVSRRSAMAQDQPSLQIIASLDLVRSLSERNPHLAIQVLRGLSPENMDIDNACSFFNA